MSSCETPPPQMIWAFFRKRYIYLKTTAEKNRELKEKFNIKNDCYVFIGKKDEEKCKKPMVIYENILAVKKFEKKKKNILECYKTRRPGEKKCEIIFCQDAEEQFAFLANNPEFSEATFRAAAQKQNMHLNEFIHYYTRLKEISIKKHAIAAKSAKKIPRTTHDKLTFHAHSIQKNNKNIKKHTSYDASEEEIDVLDPDVFSFGQSGKLSKSVKSIQSLKNKALFESTKIAAASLSSGNAGNEFCKKKDKKYINPALVDHTQPHRRRKRQIGGGAIERPMKNPRCVLERLSLDMHIYNAENNRKNINTYPSPASSDEEITNVLFFNQSEKLSKSVQTVHSSKEKIESTEIAATSLASGHTENKFCKKKEEKGINAGHVEQRCSHTGIKRRNEGGEIEIMKKNPQCMLQRLSLDMHIYNTKNIRKHINTYPSPVSSDKKITGVLSFDQSEKLPNSVQIVRSSKEKIESTEIAATSPASGNTENDFYKKKGKEIPTCIDERLSVLAHSTDKTKKIEKSDINPERKHPLPVSESAAIYTSAESVAICTSGTVKNRKIDDTQPSPDFSSDKVPNSVENIHAFKEKIESPEIAVASLASECTENEFFKKEKIKERVEIMPENLQHSFLEKAVSVVEDPHVCAHSAEEESGVRIVPEVLPTVECKNVPVDDFSIILSEDNVPDTLEREKGDFGLLPEEGGRCLSLNFPALPEDPNVLSNDYEDISNEFDISLSENHTVCDNYTPSCSVEHKTPVLENEGINECVSNVLANENIVESVPILSDFTVHPPSDDKDIAIAVGTLGNVNVSLHSVYQNSKDVYIYDDDEFDGENIYGISEHPAKQNQYSENTHMDLCNSDNSYMSNQISNPDTDSHASSSEDDVSSPSNSLIIYNSASFYDVVQSGETLDN